MKEEKEGPQGGVRAPLGSPGHSKGSTSVINGMDDATGL